MHHVIRKSLAVVIAAAAISGLVAGTASADPGIKYTGSAAYKSASINGMGSDTVQAVENGYAAMAVSVLGTSAFNSWDAINPKTGAKHDGIKGDYRRANGSGEGQAAISRAFDGGIWPLSCASTSGKTTTLTGKIQYARSSAGPKVPGTAGNSQLTFIPFARDAVSYAYKGTAATLGALSLAKIQGIYEGTISSVSGVTVHPFLPQAGSGTRSFFLTKVLGLTAEPSFWATLPTTQENSATALTVTGDLMPFSAANWIAQKNKVQANVTATAALGSAGGVVPFTGTAPKLAANPKFYSSTTFGRDVYNVVTTASITTTSPKFNKNLYSLFVKAAATGKPLLRKGDAITTAFGFSLITAGVNGSTTLKGNLVANPTSLAKC